jgi:hypothetical protein
MATIRFEKTIGSKVYKRVPNLVQGPLPRSQTRTAAKRNLPHFTLPLKADSRVRAQRWGSAAQAAAPLVVKKNEVATPIPPYLKAFASLPDEHPNVFYLEDDGRRIKVIVLKEKHNNVRDRMGLLLLEGAQAKFLFFNLTIDASSSEKEAFDGILNHLASCKTIPIPAAIRTEMIMDMDEAEAFDAYGCARFDHSTVAKSRRQINDLSLEAKVKIKRQIKGLSLELKGKTNGRIYIVKWVLPGPIEAAHTTPASAPHFPKPVQYFADLPDTHRSVFTVKDGDETIKGVCFSLTGASMFGGEKLCVLLMRAGEHAIHILAAETETNKKYYAHVELSFRDLIAGLSAHLISGKTVPLAEPIQKSIFQLWKKNAMPFDAKGYAEHRIASDVMVHLQIKNDLIELGVENGKAKFMAIAKPYLADWKDLPSDRPTTLGFRRVQTNFAPDSFLSGLEFFEDALGLGYSVALFPNRILFLFRQGTERVQTFRDLLRLSYQVSFTGQEQKMTSGTLSGVVLQDFLIKSVLYGQNQAGTTLAIKLAQPVTQRDIEKYSPIIKPLLELQFGQERYGFPHFSQIQVAVNDNSVNFSLTNQDKGKQEINWKLGPDGLPLADSVTVVCVNGQEVVEDISIKVSAILGFTAFISFRLGHIRMVLTCQAPSGGIINVMLLSQGILNLPEVLAIENQARLGKAIKTFNELTPKKLDQISLDRLTNSTPGHQLVTATENPVPIAINFPAIDLKTFKRKTARDNQADNKPTVQIQWGSQGTVGTYEVLYADEQRGKKIFRLLPKDDAPAGEVLFVQENGVCSLQPGRDCLVFAELYDRLYGQIFSLEPENSKLTIKSNRAFDPQLWAIEASADLETLLERLQALTALYQASLAEQRPLPSIIIKTEQIENLTLPVRGAQELQISVKKITRLDGRIHYELTGASLKIDATTAQTLGAFAETTRLFKPAHLVQNAQAEVSIRVIGLGTLTYQLVLQASGEWEALRVYPVMEWDLQYTSTGVRLLGLDQNGDDISFALERVADNPARYFIYVHEQARFLAWLRMMGQDFTFNVNHDSRMEVTLTRTGQVAGFAGAQVIGGVIPLTGIALDETAMRGLADAISPPEVIGVPSVGKGLLDVRTVVIDRQPIVISESQYLRFAPGETLVPSANTVNWLKAACIDTPEGPVFNLMPGSLYWYEVQATKTGVTLRLPVRFRPDRSTRPFAIDKNERLRAYITGEDPQKEGVVKTLRDDRLQVEDNGGNWMIYLLEGGYLGDRVREFRLAAAVSAQSSVLISLFNAFNSDGNATDEDAFRSDAHERRDAFSATVLGTPVSGLPQVQFTRPLVSVAASGDVVLQVFASQPGQHEWSKLSGVSIDRVHNRLVFGRTPMLSFGSGENEAVEVAETIPVIPIADPHGAEGTYRLLEVLQDSATQEIQIGRVFSLRAGLWIINQLTDAQLHLPASDLAKLLAKFDFPMLEHGVRSFGVRSRSYVTEPKVKVDLRIPETPRERQGFVYPHPEDILEQPTAREIDDALLALHDKPLFPVMPSLYAQLLNGREVETMGFLGTDGTLFLAELRTDTENRARYVGNTKDKDSALPGRLFLPHPSLPGKFIDVPGRFGTKQLSSGTMVIEGVLGRNQLPVHFDMAATKRTINGRKAFGLRAGLSGLPNLTPMASVRAYLLEWMDHLKLDLPQLEGAEAQSLVDQDRYRFGQNIILKNGLELGLSILKSCDAHTGEATFELRGVRLTPLASGKLEATVDTINAKLAGGLMTITRAQDGGALYTLVDENENAYVLVVANDGRPWIWALPPGVQTHLNPARSRPFKMVGLQGQTFTSGADSSAIRRRISDEGVLPIVYEIELSLGRSDGASELSHSLSVENLARMQFRLSVAKDGRMTLLPRGRIKGQGANRYWQEAIVEEQNYGDGRVRVVVKGIDVRKGGYTDYAWADFAALTDLSDATHFQVAGAHFNQTNRSANVLPSHPSFGSHDGFLFLLYGAVSVDAELKAYLDEAINTLLSPDDQEKYLSLTGTASDMILIEGALRLLTGQEKTGTSRDVAISTFLHLIRERQALRISGNATLAPSP